MPCVSGFLLVRLVALCRCGDGDEINGEFNFGSFVVTFGEGESIDKPIFLLVQDSSQVYLHLPNLNFSALRLDLKKQQC